MMEQIAGNIAAGVRKLRTSRGWTQTELAEKLHLSQSRLSQIERGDGSFTAEQFLTILKLFNASIRDFGFEDNVDAELNLQNALARLGATYLQESEKVLPTGGVDLSDIIRDALVSGFPRYVTALGPVLIQNLDRVHLQKPEAELSTIGLQRRFPWLVENILAAIECNLPQLQSRNLAQRYRRAQVVLGSYLDVARQSALLVSQKSAPDILDSEIRSQRTLERVKSSRSPISERWGIITSLKSQDFVEALQATHG